jgi:hypothetical protein
MRSITYFNLASVVLVCAVAAGCRGGDPEVPPAQTQTATSGPANQPTTVTGCLRAGDAENTFVLTTAQTADGTPAATYHLTGDPGVNLVDHIGRRVEVSGLVNEQAQITTRQAQQPAENATGTAGRPGTPTVQTGTELAIKRLVISSVKRAGGDCER